MQSAAMKFQLMLFVLLCVTPVFLYPSTDKDTEVQVAANGDVNGEEKVILLRRSETASSIPSKNQGRTKKRPDKQVNLRRNQLGGAKKRPQANSGKRRKANSKKGAKKAKPSPITFLPRSEMTDQLNQVMDDTFAIYSQQLTYKTFNLKVRNMAPNLKIQPWAYLTKQSPEESERRTKRENTVATVEDDKAATVDLEEDDDEDDEEGDEDVALELDMETEDQQKEDHNEDHDEDDDDNEADEEMVKFTAGNDTSHSGFAFSQTPEPLAIDDKTVEYNFKLLSANDIDTVQDVGTGSNSEDASARSGRKSQQGKFQRTPKRPNAVVEGLEKIQRMGDVMVGTKNATMRIFDVPIEVGPIRFVMKDSAQLELKNSRVESPVLSARLRLTEKNGKIVMARIRPTKIHRSRSVVTAVLPSRSGAPSKRQSARLVTHLSKEMARIWNTGYLLRRTGRRFKQLINNNGTEPVETTTLLSVQ